MEDISSLILLGIDRVEAAPKLNVTEYSAKIILLIFKNVLVLEKYPFVHLTYSSTSSTATLSRDASWRRHILSSRSSVVVWLRVLMKYGGLWREQHILVE